MLDAKRKSAIEGRLRDGFTVARLTMAIDGAARAPYVNERGKRFDDIELICRNASKVEDFIERSNGDGDGGGGSVSRIGPRPNRPSAGDLIDEIRANAGAA